jgi:hypothetical protein
MVGSVHFTPQRCGLGMTWSRAQGSAVTLVPTPNQRSWLNRFEIYFSIVQRKVFTPARMPNESWSFRS